MFFLRIKDPQGQITKHYLKEGALIIGRSPTADLKIKDQYASRRHARLYTKEGILFAEDLQSSNGTTLNTDPLLKPAPLADGDVLQVSNHKLYFSKIGSINLEIAENRSTLYDADHLLKEALSYSKSGPKITSKQNTSQHLQHLRLLLDINSLNTESTEALINLATDKIFGHFNPDQALILLRRKDGKLYEAARRSTPEYEGETLKSDNISRITVKERHAILIRDTHDDGLLSAESLQALRSLLAVPILDEAETIGTIVILSRSTPNWFSRDDLRLMTLIGSSLSLKIRNYNLLEENISRRRELELAREIQRGLNFQHTSSSKGYDVYCDNTPSQAVSGDYFKVEHTEESRQIIISIVDVSGKGISAALLTASLEALSEGLIAGGKEPDQICHDLSESLYRRTPPEKYATCIILAIDTEAQSMKYCNAGHPPGIIVKRSGEVSTICPTGPPLGILEETQFSQNEFSVDKDDLVILYSDGITETSKHDDEEEEYGIDRLIKVCNQNRTADLETLALCIEKDLFHFSKDPGNHDDRTLVILRRSA